MSPVQVVAGLIHDRSHRLLICLRPPGKHLAGFWEFPGGKIEPDETPEAALIRELREELAITVTPGKQLTPVIHDYGRGPIRLIPIVCTIAEGNPQPLEHAELRWCAPADFQQLPLAAADLPILAEWLAIGRDLPNSRQA